jgi:hypothetical protein
MLSLAVVALSPDHNDTFRLFDRLQFAPVAGKHQVDPGAISLLVINDDQIVRMAA